LLLAALGRARTGRRLVMVRLCVNLNVGSALTDLGQLNKRFARMGSAPSSLSWASAIGPSRVDDRTVPNGNSPTHRGRPTTKDRDGTTTGRWGSSPNRSKKLMLMQHLPAGNEGTQSAAARAGVAQALTSSEVHRTNPSVRPTTHCRHRNCYDGNLTETCRSGAVTVRSKTTHS
jgi:hypothetical protein